MKTYISNPKLSNNKFDAGLISLKDGEFYFSFTIPQSTNFDLAFKFQENENVKSSPLGFSISNTNLGVYKNNGNTTYLSNIEKDKTITFFEDTLRISNASELSPDKGIFPYLRGDSPAAIGCTSIDKLYITENNKLVEYILPKESQRIYSIEESGGTYKVKRQMQNKTTMFKNISSGTTKYYYNSNNIFDSAISYEWKIIIAQGGKELSIFTKKANESSYTKKETILYNQNIENCFIMLEINDEMTLNNCSFRFFKADIS